MRTMNYLLLMGLIILGSSCEHYSPFDRDTDTGSESEEETYYLELDFHQLALENEQLSLRAEQVEIEEQLENGNEENQVRLEEIQTRLAEIEENLAFNGEVLSFRGVIPGGGFPPRCIPESRFRPCPMPFMALDNFVLLTEEFENGNGMIQFLDSEGDVAGEMVEMQPIPETEGLFTRAIFDYNAESAVEIVITKLNTMGETRSTSYLLE